MNYRQLVNANDDVNSENNKEIIPQEIIIDEAIDAAAAETFCWKKHSCGHNCLGVPGERHCMPCLNVECAETSGHFEGVNTDELCTICYTSELGTEPCSRLSCGHTFHTDCIV